MCFATTTDINMRRSTSTSLAFIRLGWLSIFLSRHWHSSWGAEGWAEGPNSMRVRFRDSVRFAGVQFGVSSLE